MDIKSGDLVTISIDENTSNTYIVHENLGEESLLYHPLFEDCYIIKSNSELNMSAPNIKDSTERSLDFVVNSKKYLDYNTVADLEALCLYFVVKKKLTPRQKNILSNITGMIASIHFDNDVKMAMKFIEENNALFDDFNAMWYNNFKGLFVGQQPITSKKQRASIFNMAGFLLAELNNPITRR